MNIARSGRLVFIAQWILAVVLPVWLAGGRELLGVPTGWMTLTIMVLYWPILIPALLAPPIVSLFDRDVREAKAVRVGYSIAMGISWLALFLAAFAIPDVGDNGAHPSAIMNWFGLTESASHGVTIVLFVVAGAGLLAALVVAIAGAVRARRTPPG